MAQSLCLGRCGERAPRTHQKCPCSNYCDYSYKSDEKQKKARSPRNVPDGRSRYFVKSNLKSTPEA
ncbi:MAG: hypothetical protein OHK0037_14170 [Elainellaceae cyanobacterium]